MRKGYILILSLLWVGLFGQDCEINTINSSFEQPTITQNGSPSFINADNVPGWGTTAPDNIIEMWPNSNSNGGVPAYDGNQYIELNANYSSGVFQDFDTPIAGVEFQYSFAHRRRGTYGTDVLQVLAGPPGGPYTSIGTYSAGIAAWVIQEGTYIVPAGQVETRFIFEAVSTATGDPTVGNFLDAINFKSNFGLASDPDISLSCENNIAEDIESVGAGTWMIDAGNPSPTTIDDVNSNTPIISGFDATGDYYYIWSNGYCDAELVIHYSNEDLELINDELEIEICELESIVNLKLYEPQITDGLGTEFTYYEDLNDALDGNNNFIPNPTVYNLITNTTIYVRVEKDGFCFAIAQIELELVDIITPEFESINLIYCVGQEADILGLISDNGMSGTWFPTEIDTSEVGTFTYTFTPEDDCSEEITIEITIEEQLTPTFSPIDSICQFTEAPTFPLPNEGVTGTWSPATIDTTEPGTFTYTFTPDEECFEEVSIEIIIDEFLIPTFNSIDPICQFETAPDLPVSNEGINGTWFPTEIDSTTVGTFIYTFTPDEECAETVTIEVVIQDLILPTFQPIESICQFSEAPELPQPNEGYTGVWSPAVIDTTIVGTFTYTFIADGSCSEEVSIEITIDEEVSPEFTLLNGYCQFETPETLNTVSNNGFTGTWFPATIDTSTPGTFTYIFTPETDTCSNEFNLVVEIFEQPVLNSVPVQYLCDQDFDGAYETNLNDLTPTLGGGNVNYTFFASLADLNNDLPIPGNQWNNYSFTELPKTIYVIGTNPQGCDSEAISITFNEGEIVPHNPGPFGPIDYCPEDTVDLTQFEGNISTSGAEFKYFNTFNDARFETGTIGSPTLFVPTNNQTSVFVRLNSAEFCSAIIEIELNRLPTPSLELLDEVFICMGDELEVTASSDLGDVSFVWTLDDGTEWNGATQTITQPGNYNVTAYSEDGCRSETHTLVVHYSSAPVIVSVDITGNSIIVMAANNGEGDLEYSLDKVLWQSSNRFDNLVPGEDYTVWVRSKGCMMVSYDVTLLSIPNFLSPNGDGKNDTWSIRGIDSNSVATIKIFDRYGKIFVDRTFQGTFEWDGRYMGRSVASGDYWYIIHIPAYGLQVERKYSGHLTVRNY